MSQASNLAKWKGYIVKPGSRVRLPGFAPHNTPFCPDKPSAREELKKYRKEIDELVRVLGAEAKRSLVVVPKLPDERTIKD